ncbi:GNAT family N-acetyltransferase [Streptomyces sp. NPDC006971]|uniref:GNAT family N-acetyltransferase n=1 Tax=Streptomyces sp. NPDC006971 TaxID=3154784 RepID=UPI0033CD717C
MILRPATTADVDDLMALRIEAEGWLAAAGIDQWRNPQTRGPALAKWMADIKAGRTWVVENHQAVLATVTLAPADMDFWRESDLPDTAVYVAKLITSRAAKGSNLGGRLLDWVGRQAREQGKPWVRLDCWRDNVALQRFYLREGFEHVRTEAPTHRLSGWMGQRPASVVRHPEALLTSTDAPEVAS